MSKEAWLITVWEDGWSYDIDEKPLVVYDTLEECYSLLNNMYQGSGGECVTKDGITLYHQTPDHPFKPVATLEETSPSNPEMFSKIWWENPSNYVLKEADKKGIEKLLEITLNQFDGGIE